ncbi:LAFA_0A07184g1_1 [Lachancea sp. 'fantastica']|nr:LAFA_0A07184g1_1 [Lachancea sp. 'fantastica']
MGVEPLYLLQNQHAVNSKDSFSETSSLSSSSSVDVQGVIEEAGSLVEKLKSCSRIIDSNAGIDNDDSIVCSKSELVESLEKLNQLLTSSNDQVNGLKFKNMMLTSSIKDSTSRFEVESELQKQQSERIRCQLVMNTHQLQDKLRVQDLKLLKYKKTIREKNVEINKLRRLLNRSGTSNPQSLHHTPQSITKPPKLHRISKLQHKNSNMLTTLGLLASHVLSERKTVPTNVLETTESDISHDSFYNRRPSSDTLSRSPHLLTIPTLPKSSSSMTPISEKSSSNILPKFHSFSAFADSQQ